MHKTGTRVAQLIGSAIGCWLYLIGRECYDNGEKIGSKICTERQKIRLDSISVHHYPGHIHVQCIHKCTSGDHS